MVLLQQLNRNQVHEFSLFQISPPISAIQQVAFFILSKNINEKSVPQSFQTKQISLNRIYKRLDQ